MSPGQSHCKSTPTEQPHVSGCWQKAETWHHSSHRQKPSLPHHHTVSGESRSTLSLSPAGSARLPVCCHIPGILQDCPQGGRQSRNRLGELDFHFPPSALSFSCHHIGKSAPSFFLCRAWTEAPQPHLRLASEASKPGRASPAGKGGFASTTCWGQTPGLLCPGWALALKTMMEMSRSNRDALLMVLPHTEHAGATKLWLHGSVSCPLRIVILGEESPVFAQTKLKIRVRDPRNTTVPGFPTTTTTKNNRGVSSHLQATP